MSNSTQNETHNVCNERLAREGGQARCCDCEPHEGCTLGMKPTQQDTLQDTVQDTQNDIATFGESNSGITARIIYELVTSGRFSKEDSIKIIEANIADARKEALRDVLEEMDKSAQGYASGDYVNGWSDCRTVVAERHRVLATLKEERV